MSRAILLSLFAATAVVAGVPVTFSQGSPAKADEVNKNFNYLDSAVGKKASQASLDAVAEALKNKADASALSGKADQSKLDDLAKTVATKADTSKLRELSIALASKTNQIYIDTALKRRADTTWVKDRINAAQTGSGALLTKNNLSELKGSAVTVRENLGLGALATKSSLSASDVGALDFETASKAFLSSNKGIGTGEFHFTAGNDTSEYTDPDPTVHRDAKFGGKGIATMGLHVQGDLSISSEALTFLHSGQGTYTRSVLYSYPPSGFPAKGVYLEIPRLEENNAAAPSNFEINVRGGNYKILDFDGTANLITLHRPTKINDLTVVGSVKTVAGTIKSSDVADYVFEPDYKLMPLAEVEAFTKTNKHLPEVPSAAEIERSGLDLAKMNLILLKKVEELTLHAIDLEKRLKAVEAKD